jgi:hypothetical protein
MAAGLAVLFAFGVSIPHISAQEQDSTDLHVQDSHVHPSGNTRRFKEQKE